MPYLPINLQSPLGLTPPIAVGQATKLIAGIRIVSTATWSTAVVGIEESVEVGSDYETWTESSPTVRWSTGTKFRSNVGVGGKTWIRFRVITAEAANDADAVVVYALR